MPTAAALALIGAIAGASCNRELQSSIPITEVQVNDNRAAAGVERDGVLSLQLMIAVGTWRAEMALPSDRVLAFAEAGRPLVTPGPLVRVREGTTIAVSIDNRFGDDIVVHGLHDRPGPPVPLRVPANGTAVVRFRPGPAGTYYYWGTRGETLEERGGADSLLTGALIVDAPEARTDDRVFVIGHNKAIRPPSLDAWLINGRSWPDTERMTYQVGKPIRWRWINANGSRHPMHLHGHYFRVISAGDNTADTARAVDRAPLVVTELLEPGATMMMEWSPERSGNWLFHCHTLLHTMPDNRLPMPRWFEEYAALPHDQHMAGMVLGVQAEGGPAVTAAGVVATPRRITLRVGERPGVGYDIFGVKRPGLGYGLEDGPISSPGPALTLERGQPVEITVRNRTAHATTVHWHGIELDSYYDGVPHLGGAPYIEPGGEFLVRFTPPRAGTFIYHAHFNDYAQISTGLYGALVVLDPGRTFDPARDHTFVVSRGGADDEKDPVLLNGAIELPAATWLAGVTHRVRIIGITPAGAGQVRLMRGEQPVVWRAVAKDGADLPPQAATERPADFLLGPGETYDFEIAPGQPGELRLEVLFDRPSQPRASITIRFQQ